MNQVQVSCSCGKRYWPNQKWMHQECVANSDVANTTVANNVANASNKTYRYRDAEKRRAYQREYMRKRRGK